MGREENKSQPQSLFPSSYVMVFNPASSASSATSLSALQSTYGLTVLTSVTMSLSRLGLEVMQTTCIWGYLIFPCFHTQICVNYLAIHWLGHSDYFFVSPYFKY